MQENPRGSKMLQEDEKSCPRMPKNTLQAINLQEPTMDESLKFQLLWNLSRLWKRPNKWFSRVSMGSSQDSKACLCRVKLTNLSLRGLFWSLKVLLMEGFDSWKRRERRKGKVREERELAGHFREGWGPLCWLGVLHFELFEW